MKYMQKNRHSNLWLCLILMLFLPLTVVAQDLHQITGVVVDDQREPIIGGSVTVKGTTIGTLTDIDGKYSIKSSKDAILVFSYIGMDTKEIAIKGNSVVDAILIEDSKILDEIVVIGYGTQRKKDLTTSIANIDSKEWENRPIVSAQQGLQGKASGVQVIQPSGKPGAALSVRVRGSSSLNAGNEPLYVVDGIPTNDINNLSANDIASMQVLKDASSAAIYGTRGANGVVMITTKQGESGKARIEVNSYIGFSKVSRQLKTLNTREYFDLLDEIPSMNYNPTKRGYTNWANEIYGTGVQENYQVSVSGGNEKSRYYISGGYQGDEGIISPASYERYSLRTNLSSEAKSWLKINTNLSLSRNTRMDAADNANAGRGGVVMSVLNTPPHIGIWNEDYPGQYSTNPQQASLENPVGLTDSYNRNRDYRFSGRIELDFTLMKGLHFKPNLVVDYSDNTWDKFVDPIKTGYGRNTNGKGEQSKDEYLTWINENILSYNKQFNKKHNLTVMGGMTFLTKRHSRSYISAQDFMKGTTLKTMTLNLANKINDAKTTKEGSRTMSYLARAQYDFESRYLISAGLRTDGSSKLYHRWKTFPSVSAGWRISDEKFFAPIKHIVDDSKLRMSWGMNGNEGGINNYDLYDQIEVSKQETVGQGPAIKPGKLGNRDLKWETTAQYNLGLDVSLFNSRLTADFDLYHKKTTGLLLDIKIPASSGIKLPLRNDGEIINKGFEFNINGKILTGEGINWDTNVNMSFNRNKITKLGLTPQFATANIESNGGDVIMVREGLPLGTFYGYISEGVDPETGNIRYKDLNNNGKHGVKDGIPDPGDRTVIGDAQPDFTFGFTHNLSYKNITLSAFFQGSYGNDIYNASRIDTEGMFDSKNQLKTVLNRWKRPGMITDVPKSGDINNSLNSSRFVEDGSFIRLKSLTLGYQFQKNLVQRIGLEKVGVYATANNLFTLTKYRGYDPELSWATKDTSAAQMGIDMGTYPQTRSFIFGLNLTF